MATGIVGRATVAVNAGAFVALILGSAVHAQQSGGTPVASSEASEELAEVVVTGSRIARRDYVSTSPIKTVDETFFQDSGQVSIEAAMMELPQFQRGQGSTTGQIGGGGRATLNLRGLGEGRNLVLLDGKRMPLSSAFGAVDVTVVPQSILKNVETITGGASAVYGSDAISGVVNFIPLKKLEGMRADVQYGNSQKGDHAVVDGSLSAGSQFSDGRGNGVMSVSYTSREMLRGNQRLYIYGQITPSSFIGQGSWLAAGTNQPTAAAVNALFGTKYGATGTVPVSAAFGFNDDGTLFSQNTGQNYKGPLGPDYGVVGGAIRSWGWTHTSEISSLRRYSLYTSFDYALTENVTGYAQILYTDSSTQTDASGARTQFSSNSSPFLTIPTTNPYIPADLKTLLNSRAIPGQAFRWNARYTNLPDDQWDEHYYTGQLLAGVRGKLGIRDWTWDVYLAGDGTTHVQTQLYAILRDRVQNLFNAADGGSSICAGGFNPFGLANMARISPSCAAYVQTTAINRELLKQSVAEASAQGSLATLPAGDLQVAVTAGYRKNTYDFQPDYNYASGNIESVVGGLASRGATKVSEFSGEARIPLLKDVFLARTLAIDAAYRYSKYDISGGVSTYKADLEWSPLQGLLVRGGYSRAIRAPNIGELFSSATGGQVAFSSPPAAGEPCDSRGTARLANNAQLNALCIATGIPSVVLPAFQATTVATASVSSGNIDLKPETAKTYTAGLVFTPQFASPAFSRMSVSVDYFSIDVTDVIGPIAGLSALNKCYNLDGSNPTYSPSNVYCQLITRGSDGQLQVIRTPYLNLGGLRTKGVDVSLDWRIPAGSLHLPGSGELFLDTTLGFMNSYETATFPGDPFLDQAGTSGAQLSSLPSTKATTSVGYRQGNVMVALNWQYLSAMTDRSKLTNPASTVTGAPSYSKYDLNARYKVSDKLEARFGVINLFDKQAPLYASGQYSDPGVYDLVGRAYTLGLRASF